MGLLSKSGKLTGKAVKHTVLLPLSVAVPNVVYSNAKFIKSTLQSVPYPFCPACGESKLTPIEWHKLPQSSMTYLDDTPVPELPTDYSPTGVWRCGECGYTLRVNKPTLHALQIALTKVGRQVYETTDIHNRQTPEANQRIHDMVSSRVLAARLFAGVFAMFILFMMYAAYQGKLMFLLSLISVSSVVLLLSIKSGYRAWQLYTDNMFAPDAKAQFLYWLKNHKWYQFPIDDGYDPFDLPVENPQDEEYDEIECEELTPTQAEQVLDDQFEPEDDGFVDNQPQDGEDLEYDAEDEELNHNYANSVKKTNYGTSQSMKPDVVVKPVYEEELTEQGDTTPEATQSVSLVKTDVSNPQP